MLTQPEQQVKDRIIEHACNRFFQSGFNKVTLDELSSELGISKKTMYKYFINKDNLLTTAMHANIQKIENGIEKILLMDQPFTKKIADLMLFIGNFVGKISRVFQLDMQRFAPELWKEVDRYRIEKIFSRIGTMMHNAKQEGIFRADINEHIVVMMFIHSVQSIINPEVLSQQSFSTKEAMYTIFHVIFEGALTEEARKEFIKYEISIV